MKKLFAALVWYRHNLHMLHWKTTGKDFDKAHGLCDDYVSKFNGFIDEIAEMMLSLGENPMTLQECIETLDSSNKKFITVESSKDYDSEDIHHAIDVIFESIMNIYDELAEKSEIPSDCISKLDEHRYWFRIEKNYKNKRRCKD